MHGKWAHKGLVNFKPPRDRKFNSRCTIAVSSTSQTSFFFFLFSFPSPVTGVDDPGNAWHMFHDIKSSLAGYVNVTALLVLQCLHLGHLSRSLPPLIGDQSGCQRPIRNMTALTSHLLTNSNKPPSLALPQPSCQLRRAQSQGFPQDHRRRGQPLY